MLLPKYKGFEQVRKIGEYEICLPDPPSITKIANYGKPKEKQKFVSNWSSDKEILSWDEKKRNDFEAQEWDRRTNGYWFYNCGNIEYVTGTNYLYINWFKIDIGLPSFIDSDRDFYYIWDYTVKNPAARGLIHITNRRDGKTYRAICCQYDMISKTPNSHGGIQSKSGQDAKRVFDKLVFSWKRLPYFYKPVDIGESYPKSKLEFTEPGKRTTKTQKKEYGLILDSWLDYENARAEAYDGTKQLINIQDEIGKTEDVNVYDRINIVKETVMNGSQIVGKILATTTVEDMENKGGDNCKRVWDASDPNKLLPDGQTQIGLLRYFKPAYYGFRGSDENGVPFVDEYGYSDQERTKQYQLRKREALRNSDDVISDRRKYPHDIYDCFIHDSKQAYFDISKIEQQLRHNETLPDKFLVTGDFQWKNGIQDTEVEWVPKETGKWKVAWMPKPEFWNKKIIKYGKVGPGNEGAGVFGLDPYDQDTTVDNRKSNAAAYGLRTFDPFDPFNSGIFVIEYVNRPRYADIMFEDQIMQCVFYGWPILIEKNKIGAIAYFERRGYKNYLLHRPDETHTDFSRKNGEEDNDIGIAMSGKEPRMALLYATESYIAHKVGVVQEEGEKPYMGRCYFDRLLKCWGSFNLGDEWTKYDELVGAGLAILGSRKALPKINKVVAAQFFETYKYSGGSPQNSSSNSNENPPGYIQIRDM